MKKLIMLVFAGLLVTGIAIAVDNNQNATKSSIDAAKKGRESLKEVKDAAEEAHDAAQKAHKKASELKETIQKEKAKGHGDPAVISALNQAEQYAADLINKMAALMKDTYKSLTHTKETHKAAKEKHKAAKETEALVDVQAFSL